MKTLYIDVYFMINFTVDILAIFIAMKIIHARFNIKKLLLSGSIGAFAATVELFLKNYLVRVFVAAIFIFTITSILLKTASMSRKIKFILSFYIASFLISGAVEFVYGILDAHIDAIFSESQQPANRKAIVFSLIILLVIGVLRLFIMVFSNSLTEKSTNLRIELEEKSLELEALIDTGNLVKDPMNMNPVIFIKKSKAQSIIPLSVIELSNIDSLSHDYRKRIRLVPVTRNSTTHVMTGIRVDKVFILNGSFKEEIEATVVIDKEDGTFGGYYAITPYIPIDKYE